MKDAPRPTLEPLACTLTQFRTILFPCSRAAANNYCQSGELPSFVNRGRRYVLMSEAREFVHRRAARGGAVPPEVSAQKSAAGLKGRARQLAVAKDSP